MGVENEEVASAPTEAPQEPVAHRDDVNNDVAAAIASLKGDSEPSESGNLQERPEEVAAKSDADQAGQEKAVDGRPRAPDGKFLPKDTAPVAAAADPKLPTAESPTKPSEQPSTAQVAAPVSWSAEAKALWASAPPAIQQAVLKREQEASNGIRQYSEQVKLYERAIAPIAQEAQRRGLSTEDGIQRLMDGQRFLETQPAQAILWLSQQHGIDLADLASNPPASQQPARPDPVISQVNQTVQTLEQRLQQIEFGNNLAVAQQFAASKPHYADVEDQLPDFIREVQRIDPSLTGLALLEKAYDRAVWLNPDVRAKVQAAEHAEAEKARLAAVQAKATQATKAAVSVKGASSTAAPPRKPNGSDGGTVYDDVRATIHQLRAG